MKKNLNKIKKKFEFNKELTGHNCEIIETIPDMQNSRNPYNTVEKLCYIIKNGKIIIENRIILQEIIWLNIDYYVKNRINGDDSVKKSLNSEFYEWQEETINKGRKEAIIEIVTAMLEMLTPKEITKLTKIPL